MVAAKVSIKSSGPATYSARGYSFTRGSSRVISKPEDIRYFQNVGGLSVEIIQGQMPRKPPTLPPPARDDDDLEVTGDPDPSGEATGAYSEHDLAPQTKASIVELAESEFGVKLNPNDPKKDLIDKFLAAQAEAIQGDSEE